MKNFKLIQNRPELSAEQVVGDMDFSGIKTAAIKAGAISGTVVKGSGFLKSFFLKALVLGIVISTSVVLVYKSKNPNPEKLMALQADTSTREVPKEFADTFGIRLFPQFTRSLSPSRSFVKKGQAKIETASTMPVNSVNEVPVQETQAEIPEVEKEVPQTAGTQTNASTPTVAKADRFKPSADVTCSIWQSETSCRYPKDANFPDRWDCNDVEYSYTSCEDIGSNKNLKVLRLSVGGNRNKIKLSTALKNIQLIRSETGETIYPVGLAYGNTAEDGKTILFLNRDFKAKSLVGSFRKQLDLFIVFENPKIGDQLIIKNFVQADVQ